MPSWRPHGVVYLRSVKQQTATKIKVNVCVIVTPPRISSVTKFQISLSLYTLSSTCCTNIHRIKTNASKRNTVRALMAY